MNKFFQSTCFLLLALLAFTACNQEETPYDRYIAAREHLLQTESITIERIETTTLTGKDVTAPNDRNGQRVNGRSILHFARGTQSDMFTMESFLETEKIYPSQIDTSHAMSYFKDNCLYLDDLDDSTPNYYQSKTDQKDFAARTIIMDIHDFPAAAIASQTSKITANGEEISFTLDCEKYYQYLYADIAKSQPYGSLFTYQSLPVFTVVLDKEGRLYQASGEYHICNADNDGETERKYTITFSGYNETIPDFSGFNPDDYEIYPAE
ncbi:MAG: hypothetical protein HFI72_02305 [Peptococcaceae bacterium]|nr:hypothetical protein [Peptococcaceae bacterium]